MGGNRTDGRAHTAVALVTLVSLLSFGPEVAGSPARAQTEPSIARPNVLIILTDDQRLAGTMDVLPHVLRWFGENGRTFPNAFATTPLCCPSRVTILTGCYAHNHGILDNSGIGRITFDQGTTVERYLQDFGYRTAIFGKFFNFWHVADDPSYFDRWAIISPSRASNGYSGGTWNVNGTLETIDRYSTDYIAAQGARFIERSEANDAQPWFLELATYAPHGRTQPAPAYTDAPVGRLVVTPAMSESDRSDKPPFIRTEHVDLADVAHARAGELRTLMSVDDLVARIAETLRRTDEAKDTLVFFLSDNGFLWGEHGLRSKGYPYGPDVQIPLLMRWPGRVEKGTADGRLVGTVDLAPTILDAAGIAQDPAMPMDGRSLLDASWTRDRMLLEYWPWKGSSAPGWASLWSQDCQYTEYYADDGTIMFREYYDVRKDPWELTNLLNDGDPSDDPDVGSLHEQLSAGRMCVGGSCP